jgi:hypothetical protein
MREKAILKKVLTSLHINAKREKFQEKPVWFSKGKCLSVVGKTEMEFWAISDMNKINF